MLDGGDPMAPARGSIDDKGVKAMPKTMLSIPALIAAIAIPAAGEAQVTRLNRSNAMILEAAKVAAGTDLLFISGQLAAPIDPKKAVTVEDYGDTKTQTISVLNKIKDILATQGMTMSDLVKLTLFLGVDPKTGKMDFAGANEGFKMFFKTADNPETVARSTFQAGALVAPQYLIEIEAIAAKKAK